MPWKSRYLLGGTVVTARCLSVAVSEWRMRVVAVHSPPLGTGYTRTTRYSRWVGSAGQEKGKKTMVDHGFLGRQNTFSPGDCRPA